MRSLEKGETEKRGKGAMLEGSYAGRDALRAWKEAVLEEREILRPPAADSE